MSEIYGLTIVLYKEFDNEANMRSSRDSIKSKAESTGYDCKITFRED